MSKFVRVFHPSLNSWQDVPGSAVEEWKESGWSEENPGNVDDSGAPPLAPEVAQVEPELEATAPWTTAPRPRSVASAPGGVEAAPKK